MEMLTEKMGGFKNKKNTKKKMYIFSEKEVHLFRKRCKTGGGVSKIAPTDQKDANLVLGYFKSIRLVYGRCERI